MALNRMLVSSVAIAGTVAALAAAPVASAEPRDLFLDELATLNIPLIGGTQADTVGGRLSRVRRPAKRCLGTR